MDYFEQALNEKETDSAYSNLLFCYIKLGKYDSCETLLKRCEQQDFPATFNGAGLFYAKHKDFFNAEKALYWFQKGIDLNYPDAFFSLGECYRAGCKAFKADGAKAIEYYRRGLELNDPKWNGRFANALGHVYSDQKEYQLAREYFEKAIAFGNEYSHLPLARLYRDGLGGEQDLEQYINHLLERLTPETALELGGIFSLGEYTRPNFEAAFAVLSRGANLGDAPCAIMCAGLLASVDVFNENAVNRYLEIAFRSGANNEKLKASFDAIIDLFGEKVGDRVWELAEKYWHFNAKNA